jgi:hypothetical protein
MHGRDLPESCGQLRYVQGFLNRPVRVVLEKAYETFHAVHSHVKDGAMNVSVSMAFSTIGVLSN